MKVSEICMYLDFKTDESYTPSKIAIRVQNSFEKLQEVQVIEFDEPIGWYSFKLGNFNFENANMNRGNHFIKTMFVQIAIVQNQHSGRDTHVRQIKIFAPREEDSSNAIINEGFKDINITQFGSIR